MTIVFYGSMKAATLDSEVNMLLAVPRQKKADAKVHGQKKEARQFMLTPEASDLLDLKAEQLGITRSELIERVIRSGGLDTADKFEATAS